MTIMREKPFAIKGVQIYYGALAIISLAALFITIFGSIELLSRHIFVGIVWALFHNLAFYLAYKDHPHLIFAVAFGGILMLFDIGHSVWLLSQSEQVDPGVAITIIVARLVIYYSVFEVVFRDYRARRNGTQYGPNPAEDE